MDYSTVSFWEWVAIVGVLSIPAMILFALIGFMIALVLAYTVWPLMEMFGVTTAYITGRTKLGER